MAGKRSLTDLTDEQRGLSVLCGTRHPRRAGRWRRTPAGAAATALSGRTPGALMTMLSMMLSLL